MYRLEWGNFGNVYAAAIKVEHLYPSGTGVFGVLMGGAIGDTTSTSGVAKAVAPV